MPDIQADLVALKVLIIDDQSDVRVMTRMMLSEMGVTQVFEAKDGREALSLIDEAPDMVDMVICDWNMPRITGIDLLRQVRSVNPDLPFLMLTGRKDMESIVEAKTSGVSAYIAKPFSQAQLEVKMRVLLKQRRA
jgi:two-component system, chemotaxis family, chemotaxis protein CheY